MTATEQQMCDGYFFMSKQPRPGSPEWGAAHPDKMGGRRRKGRKGTRKGRKGTRKGGKSRRNRH